MSELPPNERPQSEEPSGVSSGAMWGGLVLIGIGVIFLLVNMGLFSFGALPQNWWALFFLLPIAGILVNVFRAYKRDDGSFRHTVSSQLIGAGVLALIMFVFLFGLDWGKIWPAFLIIAGLGALSRTWARGG